MKWTTEAKVQYLMRLPWTIVPDESEEGDRLLRVAELPAAVGCGETDKALAADFFESFAATLEAYVEADETPPLPEGESSLPWLVDQEAPSLKGTVRYQVSRNAPVRERVVITSQRTAGAVHQIKEAREYANA